MAKKIEEQNSVSLKIDKNYPFIAHAPPAAVFIIGAGGTGSYVVPGLARDIYTMKKRPQLILCDGDVVEDKNLKRQHFVSSDIGQNKALALANRYAAAFGIEVGYKDEFIETTKAFADLLNSVKGNVLVITCVDNIKTRMLFREAFLAHTKSDVYWIDCGNESEAGQAVLAARVPWWKKTEINKGRFPMPDVFDLYPELVERAKADKLPTEMSCAELAASSPQYGFINLTAATMALNWAHDLLHTIPIRTNVAEFSIKNKYMHRPLTESKIASWIDFFKPFKKFNLFDNKKKVEKAEDKEKKATSVKDIKSALGR